MILSIIWQSVIYRSLKINQKNMLLIYLLFVCTLGMVIRWCVNEGSKDAL